MTSRMKIEITEVENGFLLMDRDGPPGIHTAWVAKDPNDLAILIQKIVTDQPVGRIWRKADQDVGAGK